MAQSCGGDAVSMQGAVVKALVRLVMERPVVLFAAKSGRFYRRTDTSRLWCCVSLVLLRIVVVVVRLINFLAKQGNAMFRGGLTGRKEFVSAVCYLGQFRRKSSIHGASFRDPGLGGRGGGGGGVCSFLACVPSRDQSTLPLPPLTGVDWYLTFVLPFCCQGIPVKGRSRVRSTPTGVIVVVSTSDARLSNRLFSTTVKMRTGLLLCLDLWQSNQIRPVSSHKIHDKCTAAFAAVVRLGDVVLFLAALFLPRGNNHNSSSQDVSEHREYLPQAWQRAVTFRVLLQRRQKRPRSSGGGCGGGGGGGGALSLFTARVLSLRGDGGAGGSSFKGASAASGTASGTGRGGSGGGGGGGGGGESRAYCFVVTDDGIHDVPAAATLGEGEGWEGR